MTTGRTVEFQTKDGPWRLTGLKVEDWQRIFPNLDVQAEMIRAAAWIEANQTRRKTANGMLRFCFNWLQRSNDQATPINVPAKKAPSEQSQTAKEWIQQYAMRRAEIEREESAKPGVTHLDVMRAVSARMFQEFPQTKRGD